MPVRDRSLANKAHREELMAKGGKYTMLRRAFDGKAAE